MEDSQTTDTIIISGASDTIENVLGNAVDEINNNEKFYPDSIEHSVKEKSPMEEESVNKLAIDDGSNVCEINTSTQSVKENYESDCTEKNDRQHVEKDTSNQGKLAEILESSGTENETNTESTLISETEICNDRQNDEHVSNNQENAIETVEITATQNGNIIEGTLDSEVRSSQNTVQTTNASETEKCGKKSPKKRINRSKMKKVSSNGQARSQSNSNYSDKYMLSITPRQRRYFLVMPRGSRFEAPSDDCEIFISNIPINIREGELIPLFERFGKIWELRLLMSQRNPNRNAEFAFVRFMTNSAATRAAQTMNKYEILPGKHLSIRLSEPNLCLFVGNIHRGVTRDEIKEKMSRLTDGLVKTTVKNSFYEDTKNCGFCFLEYESHKAAMNARRLLSEKRVWGRHLFVDWSERRRTSNVANEDESHENKTVFINYLPKEITDERLKEIFAEFGTIERITRIKDYAFILYEEHSSAMNAVANCDKSQFRSEVEVSLAMPKVPAKRMMPSNIPRFNMSTSNRLQQHSNMFFANMRLVNSRLNANNRFDGTTASGSGMNMNN